MTPYNICLGAYVILETKRFKVKNVPENQVSLANNMIHLNVNFLGMTTLFLFVVFLSNSIIFYYLEGALILGCIYFYLTYFKRSGKVQMSSLFKTLFIFLIGAFFASLIGYLMFLSPELIYVFVISMFIYLTIKLLKRTNKQFVSIYIASGFNYGAILLPIMASLMVLVLNGHKYQNLYQGIYVFEPLISLLVSVLFTVLIAKNKISTKENDLAKSINYYGYLSLVGILSIWLMRYDTILSLMTASMLFFIAYSFSEYVMTFNQTQIILQNDLDAKTMTMFNIYFNVIISGVVPVLFIMINSLINYLFKGDFYHNLFISITLTYLVAMIVNLLSAKGSIVKLPQSQIA